ncbi:MAG: hypothetical protein LBD03_06615 [Methanobrevibacter sp.]|nr:hypothetical protein [Candidatus Methanovirga procula]
MNLLEKIFVETYNLIFVKLYNMILETKDSFNESLEDEDNQLFIKELKEGGKTLGKGLTLNLFKLLMFLFKLIIVFAIFIISIFILGPIIAIGILIILLFLWLKY